MRRHIGSRMPDLFPNRIFQLAQSIPAQQGARVSHAIMYWAFLLCMLLYPFGHSFQEIGPIIGLIALGPYYYWNWQHSALRRFGLRWAWLAFMLLIFFKTAYSIAPLQSWQVMLPNIWQGFVLPVIAMECIRDGRDLRRFVLVFALAACAEGLDGIYQFVTGADLILGTQPLVGRLTGSMSTPRVGNYMAMALIPSLGLGFLLPRGWRPLLRWGCTLLLLFPGLFLLVFSQTRSGYLGFGAALLVLAGFVFRKIPFRYLAGLVLAVVLLVLFGPQRIHWTTLMQDPRWELWRFALDVFRAHPWFGAGVSAYNPAFNELGLVAVINGQDIPHPHNVYLQLLCEMGLVGFAAAMTALLGPLIWGYGRIRRGLAASGTPEQLRYWQLTAMFWGGYFAYLTTCLSGHNFFRTWWLGLGMALLGFFCGACVRSRYPFVLPGEGASGPSDIL